MARLLAEKESLCATTPEQGGNNARLGRGWGAWGEGERPKGGPEGRARCDGGSYGHRQQSATKRRPVGPCPLRRRKLRASTAERDRKAAPFSISRRPSARESRHAATLFHPHGKARRGGVGGVGGRERPKGGPQGPCPLRRRKLRASTAERGLLLPFTPQHDKTALSSCRKRGLVVRRKAPAYWAGWALSSCFTAPARRER